MWFEDLKKINSRPKPFQFYTANELRTNVAGNTFPSESLEIAIVARKS
jgi:hypothetical protein